MAEGFDWSERDPTENIDLKVAAALARSARESAKERTERERVAWRFYVTAAAQDVHATNEQIIEAADAFLAAEIKRYGAL